MPAAAPPDTRAPSPLKVLLVANYEADAQTSMLAFRDVLERELPGQGCDVRVVAPPRKLLRAGARPRLAKWLGYVDKFILFVPELKRRARWADVVHICDHSNAMYVPRLRRQSPTFITCHDVIAIQAALGMVPDWHVGRMGRLFQRLIARGLGQADLIGCVSNLTRHDLLELGLAPERKVIVTQNGLNADFAPVPADEAQRLVARFGIQPGERYLLHVGVNLPRKNKVNVLKAFAALIERARQRGQEPPATRLAFVGPALSDELAALARELGVAERIANPQEVSHEELRALYSGAAALVFPSLQEGFGWPIIEAQACGCPVITSDLAPMNEIGGEAAVYADPLDAQKIADAIEAAAARFAQMRELGLANARLYTAEKMASGYVAAYRRVLAERRGAA